MNPTELAALDAWITRSPDPEICAPCAICEEESNELDAAEHCPECAQYVIDYRRARAITEPALLIISTPVSDPIHAANLRHGGSERPLRFLRTADGRVSQQVSL